MKETIGILLIGSALFCALRALIPYGRFFKRSLTLFTEFLSRHLSSGHSPLGSPLHPNSYVQRVSQKLERAGIPGSQAMAFLSRQAICGALGLVAGLSLTFFGLPAYIVPTFLGISLFWPSMKLQSRIRRRQKQIVLTLPYYLDLLTFALEAGLDLVVALEEVIRNDSPNPLREELILSLRSIQMGNSRVHVFTKLGERTGVEPLMLWASAIRQSEELGASLGTILRIQSESLRRELVRIAEEEAQRAPLKMLGPLVVFIFPALFVLLFAPLFFRLFPGS